MGDPWRGGGQGGREKRYSGGLSPGMSQSLLLSEPQLLNLRIENNSLSHKALCKSKRNRCFYKIKRFLVIFYLKDYILKFKKIIKKNTGGKKHEESKHHPFHCPEIISILMLIPQEICLCFYAYAYNS